ncbi:MAG TPA: LLM class flavin-dependent oxidoreductase [Actinomycetota bacterium]|nr:LLM class flavin-dependent oxidoreductase [Actinomycetota bacterium]
MSVLLGATLPQFTNDGRAFVDAARRAEAAGLDSLWVFDHVWPLTGGKRRPILECWTALAHVAAATERALVGTLVTRSSLRHPAVLAKMAATVAAIAPGRVVVTMGSGDASSRAENESFGIPYHAADRRVAQFESTVSAVRAYLHDGTVSQSDDFAALDGLPASPRPTRPPALWVAGRSGDALALAARLGDGWNGWGGTPDEFARDAALVAAEADGRPVELTWGGLVGLAADDDEARRRYGGRGPDWVVGGPERVAARLRSFVDAGARHVVCTLPDAGAPGALERLARAVRPLVVRPRTP